MDAPARPHQVIVVPCYNEEQRLDVATFEHFARDHAGVRFVMVNDGSRDGTLARLIELRSRLPHAFDVLDQPRNTGKAEAVRAGMLHALGTGCDACGYWDADLATPLDELAHFAAALRDHPEVLMVFGARVQLLGRSIARSTARHYLGRVFATAASSVLRLPIYDTQCGAKLFRAGATTRALFATPFRVRWTFDVELIARLIRLRRQLGQDDAAQLIYEIPLHSWRDVPGSKVGAFDFARAQLEIARIYAAYLRPGAPPLPLDAGVHEDRVPM
jgi:glycosyltransferase involved in cell wall biosynthesis